MMDSYLIMCRSLTYAQRAARTIERTGITAGVVRAPKEVSGEGCGYGVRVSERRFGQAMRALREANVPFRRVYRQQANGKLHEVTV